MLSWCVYVLRSLAKDFVYIGSTNDLERRMGEHNNGEVQSTKAYRPLKVAAFVAVETETRAKRFSTRGFWAWCLVEVNEAPKERS
ncbi:MAG: GIY-YIG nuclease family protein [Bacteroidota bacterium]